MLRKRIGLNLIVALPLAFLFGCTESGKVDQGRVVGYDKEKRTVTIIREKNVDARNPDYSHLPPAIYVLPSDPKEMGPEPKAGGRMKLNVEKGQMIIFDPASRNFKEIDFKIIEKWEDVDKQNPLVYDHASGTAKKFPMVNKDRKTVTIYSSRRKLLVTFTMPETYFTMPESTWDAGDEVRVYYKEEGKAIRFMNISKTDIFAK